MARLLASSSLLMQLISSMLLSLGVLSPEAVRSIGNRLANFVLSKPDSALLRRAHTRIVGSTIPTQSTSSRREKSRPFPLSEILEPCSIELSVLVLTFAVASILSLVFLLSVSLWGILAAIARPDVHPLLLAFSMAGLLISVSGVCAIFEPHEVSSRAVSPFVRVLTRVLRVVSKPWRLSYPLQWLMLQLVSIFTLAMPLAWYRSLKAVHVRGVNWAFTALGLTLLVLSIGLQLYLLLTAH